MAILIKISQFKVCILFLVITFCISARAEKESRDLTPGEWTRGVHLLAGGGLNSAFYTSDTTAYKSGVGLNLTTHLGYYMNHSWAVEWSSSVGFSRVEDNLLWNTILTIGARIRMPEVEFYEGADSFVRVYFGRGATVLFPNTNTTLPVRKDVDRIQFDGGAGGISVGAFYQVKTGETIFFELSATHENLEKSTGIKDHEEVPSAVFERDLEDHSRLFEISLAFGVQAF